MSNPLYQQLMGTQPASNVMPQRPFNPLQQIMSAMNNPAAFIKQRFPDIPDSMMSDPNQILSYLQQTRGISGQQIQQLVNQYGGNMYGKY